MNNSVIAAVLLNDSTLAVWFDNGISKKYAPQDLGVDGACLPGNIVVVSDGEGIAWENGGSIGADELFAKGIESDYVEQEKRQLLKSLSAIRREASFSQTRLGEAAGIRQSVISRIEGCEISPQINTLLKLLAPLGKTLAIVDLKENKE